MECNLHVEQLFSLGGQHPRHGYSCPAGYHLGDILGIDLLLDHCPCQGALFELLVEGCNRILGLDDRAVADLCHSSVIACAFGLLGLDFKLLDTLLLLLNFADKVALVLPLGTHCRGARFQVLNLLVECCDTLLVALTAYGFTLDFELTDTAVERVQLLWLGVHFKTQSRCCLIDQIYRLVGQKSGGDVAVRKLHCRDYRLILDTHLVVVFVSLFQTSQNRHGILGRRLLDHHLLEASFECLILLEVFLKFVERSGSDSSQFASCKGGL